MRRKPYTAGFPRSQAPSVQGSAVHVGVQYCDPTPRPSMRRPYGSGQDAQVHLPALPASPLRQSLSEHGAPRHRRHASGDDRAGPRTQRPAARPMRTAARVHYIVVSRSPSASCSSGMTPGRPLAALAERNSSAAWPSGDVPSRGRRSTSCASRATSVSVCGDDVSASCSAARTADTHAPCSRATSIASSEQSTSRVVSALSRARRRASTRRSSGVPMKCPRCRFSEGEQGLHHRFGSVWSVRSKVRLDERSGGECRMGVRGSLALDRRARSNWAMPSACRPDMDGPNPGRGGRSRRSMALRPRSGAQVRFRRVSRRPGRCGRAAPPRPRVLWRGRG